MNRSTRGKRVVALAAIALFLAGGSALRGALDIEWNPNSVRDSVATFGVWAPLTFVAMVTFRLLILLPSQLLLTAGGFLFGALPATFYGALGLTLGALLNYTLVQLAGAERLRERVPPRYTEALAIARTRAGAGALVLATGYPLGPMTLVQLAAAATGMTVITYAASVAAGAFVRAATYSYFGSTLAEGDRLLVGALVIVAVAGIPFLHPRSRAWLRENLGNKND